MNTLPRHYLYKRTETRATTGYFACVPYPAPDLQASLSMLAASPLDSFLHSHVLTLLLRQNKSVLADMARECLENRDAVLADALLEIAQNSPARAEYFANLKNSLDDLVKSVPELPRREPFGEPFATAARLWRDMFKANIHEHKPLKSPENTLPPYSAETLARARKEVFLQNSPLASEFDRQRERAWPTEERISPKITVAKALEALGKADLLAGPEMRHEASLSPIALLRDWRVKITVNNRRNRYTLEGIATAYGRGLNLAACRASCLMEIVERASSYASVEPGGKYNQGKIAGRINTGDLIYAAFKDLGAKNAFLPARTDAPLHWLEGKDADGRPVYVPAQAVFLFSNLDEPDCLAANGSTGLASGNTMTEARLAALLEVLERDAHATVPFARESCFLPASRDELLRQLLLDYKARGIHIQFQDISAETGLPTYRCFVRSPDGQIVQGTGAGLNGLKAAISALTETPWPYSWATPAPFGKKTAPPLSGLPLRYLEDLPDYSLPSAKANLLLLENTLRSLGRTPVYVDISRADLGFPVTRAFVPGLETCADFDENSLPSPRLMARAGFTFY